MEQIDACIYGRKIKRIFDNCLKSIREQYDIRMIDVEILLYFYENKDKTASDLYRELGLNKGQVSTGIDRLCKKKMLLEYENSKDRRYLQYEIQPLGLQVVLHSCWTEPVFWLKDNLFSIGIFDFDNMTTQVENFNFQNDFPPFLCCVIGAQTRLVE